MTVYMLISEKCDGCRQAKEKFKKEIADGNIKLIDLDMMDAGMLKVDKQITELDVKKVPTMIACDEHKCDIIW